MFYKTKMKNESIKNVDMGVIWVNKAVNPSKFGEILSNA